VEGKKPRSGSAVLRKTHEELMMGVRADIRVLTNFGFARNFNSNEKTPELLGSGVVLLRRIA
jgi:hypothetical protein